LLKGNPEWVIDAGRSPIKGDEQGSVWVKVEHLSCYSLTGSLIPDSVPNEPEKHNGGSGFGHAVIIRKGEVSDATGEDTGTADGKGSGQGIIPEEPVPVNETLGDEAPEKNTPVEGESEGSPGFGSIFAAAGLALSAVCLRRRML
ncbi:PGF-CTERM sorting domain-containing protein, partial [Methanosarcina sp. KYL-1]|uniref:PGF-CTERM sorting domain-containing protein n=1 Tax=Methanosarcina sp. KYL-1 TaxID=2602068 RepID=UPI0021016C51